MNTIPFSALNKEGFSVMFQLFYTLNNIVQGTIELIRRWGIVILVPRMK
jgi:hypothetical protein